MGLEYKVGDKVWIDAVVVKVDETSIFYKYHVENDGELVRVGEDEVHRPQPAPTPHGWYWSKYGFPIWVIGVDESGDYGVRVEFNGNIENDSIEVKRLEHEFTPAPECTGWDWKPKPPEPEIEFGSKWKGINTGFYVFACFVPEEDLVTVMFDDGSTNEYNKNDFLKCYTKVN